MKETFKKAFGIVMGIYAACVAVNIIDNCKKTYLKVTKEKPAEENTRKSEESI